MVHVVRVKIGNEELILETGRMAKQANGSVYATYGGSSVLATACWGSNEIDGLDYVPLQVEYNEKYYAAGKIPGGFLKREGRPKDKEILVCRLIDRPMRPLFDKAFKREIQVVPTVVSTDQQNPPDMIAMVAAFASVCVSNIPFNGPCAAVRVSLCGDEYVINPTFDQIETSSLDIVVAGTLEGITMVEGGAKEVSEETMLLAIEKAQIEIVKLCNAQLELAKLVGLEKLPITHVTEDTSFTGPIREFAFDRLKEACFVIGKHIRYAAIKQVKKDSLERFADLIVDDKSAKIVDKLFEDMEYEIVRESILERGVRTDGRGVEEIRNITCEIGVLPRAHGSALFTRGETQSLAVTTLGTVYDEQMLDNIDGAKKFSRFMLHYNFPPFSVGECGRMSTGRREIGHGHLAQRALEPILPAKDDFPYTIRVVSEILESNGSSSMASVCGGSLSLLAAGVKIKKPVAGIAMGLISSDDKAVVLSDILGEEDHLGDMDFKVTGTDEGITAFQMDIKISNVSRDLMAKALDQARRGRLHILEVMNKVIMTPSDEISEYAPRIEKMKIDEEKIGAVIGPGGKNIKGIAEKSGSEVNIENDGTITIYGKDSKSAKKAMELIKMIVEEPEVGRIYQGTVKRIMDFGAFIEILPGKEGLCHISKLSKTRVNNVSDVLSLNQEIPVKLIEIDRMGRVNLSYIDALNDLEKKEKN